MRVWPAGAAGGVFRPFDAIEQGASVKYKVRLIDTGKSYVVWVPALPGCRSFGRTEGEALDKIRLAIQSYLEALEEQNAAFDSREIDIF